MLPCKIEVHAQLISLSTWILGIIAIRLVQLHLSYAGLKQGIG